MAIDNQSKRLSIRSLKVKLTSTIRARLGAQVVSFRAHAIQLTLYLAALLCALHGCALLRGESLSERLETRELAAGAPWLLIAVGLWSLAEAYESRAGLRAWWGGLDRLGQMRWLARLLPGAVFVAGVTRLWESMSAPPDLVFEALQGAVLAFALALALWLLINAADRGIRRRVARLPIPPARADARPADAPGSLAAGSFAPRVNLQPIGLARIACVAMSLLTSALVWVNTSNNNFGSWPMVGFWLVSIALWCVTLSPSVRTLFRWLRSKLAVDWRIPWRAYWWAFIAFAVILAAGLSFRITGLEQTPRELSNDIYFNLKESRVVGSGVEYPIYFPNNNGRGPSLLYITAALAAVPGFAFDHYTLKMANALSSFAALPFMLWLGIEFCGRRRKQGVVLGLLLAGLVAVSFWDVVLGRIGDVWALAPMLVASMGIFVIRAIRHNQRADYIMAGLAMGFSLYTYPPARVIPFAGAAAAIIALALSKWNRQERLACAINSLAMAFVAFVVFLPMFHFMLEYPDLYWRRVSQIVSAAGPEDAEAGTRLTVSLLLGNIREHLLMFHWRQGLSWGRGLPGAPLLDTYSGALLLLGFAAVAARMLRRRDPLVWMLPVLIVVLNLPGILVLSPIVQKTVPNNSRVLGAMPFIFLIAALALFIISRQLTRALPKFVGLPLAALLCSAMLLSAWQQNHGLYFGPYKEDVLGRAPPSVIGGRIIRGFLDSGGSEGNVFFYESDGWGETRFIAANYGSFEVYNNIGRSDNPREAVFRAWNRESRPLDVNGELLFIYTSSRTDYTDNLRALFPEGYAIAVPTLLWDYQYTVYRVPPLGEARMREALGLEQ